MANPRFCTRNLNPPLIFSGSLTVVVFRCEQMPQRVGIGVNESNTCWSKDQRYIRQKRRPTNEQDRESKEPAGRRRYGRAAGDEMNVDISLRLVARAGLRPGPTEKLNARGW
jgi:hypothetical protein